MSSVTDHSSPKTQWGVLVAPGAYDAHPVSIALDLGSAVYASLFTEGSDIQILELPFSKRSLVTRDSSDVGSKSAAILLVHARPSDASNSSSEGLTERNRLAGELLYDPCASLELQKAQRDDTETSIHGDAFVFYADLNRDFYPSPDWEALHDTLYGARLANLQLSLGPSSRTSQAEEHVGSRPPDKSDTVAKLAEEYHARYAELASKREGGKNSRCGDGSHSDADEEMPEGGDESDWTDEEVERPDPRPSSGFRNSSGRFGSDDDDHEVHKLAGRVQKAGTDDNGPNEASEEEESELESSDDDENDPKKRALLNTIRQMIASDGKLDLERLGLIERDGQLVPRDD